MGSTQPLRGTRLVDFQMILSSIAVDRLSACYHGDAVARTDMRSRTLVIPKCIIVLSCVSRDVLGVS